MFINKIEQQTKERTMSLYSILSQVIHTATALNPRGRDDVRWPF